MRITVGGNLIYYPDKLTTQTANLITTKIMQTSTISTKETRYVCGDIKSFFLKTPLDQLEYMKMPMKFFPKEFKGTYNLKSKATNGYIYMEIAKGRCRIP